MPKPPHLFTSITANYLPKARVLANSAKAVMPDAVFHLMLCDELPEHVNWEDEPFDNLLQIKDLELEHPEAWVFGHSVVELCTAVKGVAMETIFERHGADKVFYFDPDTVIFGRLDELCEALESSSILLTPHQVEPESSVEAILDNETASLKYGVFNLGFLGVSNDENGRRFSRWWADRLVRFCRDDRPAGLFTDQKWVNLAPCFFEGICVWRSPAFNVATWNITTREVAGDFDPGFTVNDEPLGFYHFSGFDSGDQALMLGKYGADNPALLTLREWYIAECERQGQSALGNHPSVFHGYASGEVITAPQRHLYRERIDLQRAFPDPFDTQRSDGGYLAWYGANVAGADDVATSGETDGGGAAGGERPPAEVFQEFCSWLQRRASLSPSAPRRWALLSLNRFLKLASSLFARP